MELTFSYLDVENDPCDLILIEINGILIDLYLEVDVDNQYYRLFNKNDQCIEHYESFKKMDENLETDLKKYYRN